jgi:hypothetical protein
MKFVVVNHRIPKVNNFCALAPPYASGEGRLASVTASGKS